MFNVPADFGVPQILVVDDETDMHALIRQKYRRAIRGGEVRFFFAENGYEALEVLERSPEISMVISDINMPRMDGLTLLGQLKTLNPNIRSVIVSAYGDLDNIRCAMNRGAYDFLTKPIDFEDFSTTLEKTLNHLADVRRALSDRDHLLLLQSELSIARDIQQSVLTSIPMENPTHEVVGFMRPARQVGGDFYDFFKMQDGRELLVVGDVSGKGVPAALFMMVTQMLVRVCAEESGGPGEILTRVNRHLVERNPASMFVTMFLGIYDPDSFEFCYASAGHETPYLLGEVCSPVVTERGMALGLLEEERYQESTITLGAPGGVFIYTDGVTDALNSGGVRYGSDLLEKTLHQSRGASSAELNRQVVSAVDDFADGVQQEDDITCLTLMRN